MMNDRFKFRAWHKEAREMVEVESVYPYQDESTQGGEIFIEGFECSFYFPEECELMQCTGLKDKNGKLIYEGDIVKDDHEALHFVKWCYNGFQLEPLFENGYTIGIVDDEIEVIGNIYENPKLLQECKRWK